MREMKSLIGTVPKERIPEILEQQGVRVNRYAREFLSHPRLSAERPGSLTVVIAALREIGFEDGATLPELFERLPGSGLKPCPPEAGVFLRLMWTDQPESGSAVLSGTHEAPEMAVTVLSEPLEEDDAFPKGLYLRKVGGVLWLRGYVCGPGYRFPGDALFAFEKDGQSRTDPGKTLSCEVEPFGQCE